MNDKKNILDKVVGSIRPAMLAASLSEDTVKILAEYWYNRLAKTSQFQQLQKLDDKVKYVVTAIAFFLNARLKFAMDESTPWGLFWKGILTDVAPEVIKRMFNHDPNPEEQGVIELISKPDGNGGTQYAPRDDSKKSEPKKEPGFCAGFCSAFTNHAKNSLQNKKGGSQ